MIAKQLIVSNTVVLTSDPCFASHRLKGGGGGETLPKKGMLPGGLAVYTTNMSAVPVPVGSSGLQRRLRP